MRKHVPNFITLLNLLSGFAATVFAIKGYNDYAAFLIIAGGIFDFSDGLAARLLKTYSGIGKDLDSLADIVTFGIAPGAIVLNLLTGSGLGFVPGFILAGLIPAASALRLAKFNNDTTQTTSFRGLATPASAFTVISFVIASEYSRFAIFDAMVVSYWFIGALSVFLSVMMLVNTRMFSLKFKHLRWSGNEERYILAGVSLLLLVILKFASPPLIMISYILISLIFNVLRRRGTSPAAA
jgi:CDP-diacylglycerol---serine O-phosphatidyltransferase